VHENDQVRGVHENDPVRGVHENDPVRGVHENDPVRGVHENDPVRGVHENDRAPRADLEHVFLREYPVVVGVAARVLGAHDQAEDVAQEVFLSFGRSRVPAEQARGWLCVAAARTALNVIRSQRRRSRREQAAAAAGGGVVPDVAETVLTEVDRARVRAALGRLPQKQAVALVLRHGGLSYAEVATALGLSPTSVGTTVRRAEIALRKELT
jgi:RNA polymerase sigma-70 factor (ECF subfamily)